LDQGVAKGTRVACVSAVALEPVHCVDAGSIETWCILAIVDVHFAVVTVVAILAIALIRGAVRSAAPVLTRARRARVVAVALGAPRAAIAVAVAVAAAVTVTITQGAPRAVIAVTVTIAPRRSCVAPRAARFPSNAARGASSNREQENQDRKRAHGP
jgi:hypothetical protein